MSLKLEEINRLDDGKGERDEKEQYGGGHEAEARDDGMVMFPPSVMSIKVVAIIAVKASTTAPAENHGG